MAEPATTARELRGFAAAVSAAAAAAGYSVSTVRVQYHSGVSNAAPYDAPIVELPPAPEAGQGEGEQETEEQAAVVAAAAGPGYIHDSLCELRFRISPTAFFQVGVLAFMGRGEHRHCVVGCKRGEERYCKNRHERAPRAVRVVGKGTLFVGCIYGCSRAFGATPRTAASLLRFPGRVGMVSGCPLGGNWFSNPRLPVYPHGVPSPRPVPLPSNPRSTPPPRATCSTVQTRNKQLCLDIFQ